MTARALPPQRRTGGLRLFSGGDEISDGDAAVRLTSEGNADAARPSAAKGRSSLPRLLSYTRREWKLLTLLFLAVVSNSLLDLAVPWVMGFVLLDKVVRRSNLNLLPLVVTLLAVIFLGQKVTDFCSDYFQVLASQRVVHRLRCDLFEHIQALPLRFFDQARTGELLARATGDADAVENLINTVTQDIASESLTFLGALVFLYVISPSLTLFVMPAIVALALSVFFFRSTVKRFARRMRDAMGEMAALAAELISGVRIVKAFCAEKFEAERFSRKSAAVFAARVKTVKLRSLYSIVSDACVLGGTLVVVLIAPRWVISGSFTVGALVAYLGYLNKTYRPVKKLSQGNILMQQILVAAERIFELMDHAPEGMPPVAGQGEQPLTMRPKPAGGPSCLGPTFPEFVGPERAAAAVRFENVRFCYEPDRPALKDFSLQVAPGEVVGVVGHSGGGKTTLVNLLLRFYEPTSGRILFDGVPLERIPPETLRRQVAIVPQETVLFSGSIRDNIAYALPEATDEQVEEVARAARAHDFIVHLPHGYLSQVGERGVKLSGGQRQRIAIARALLRNPRVLIFDEATSHLDSESDRLVQQALAKIAPARTVFVIAHRLSTIFRADNIVVIEDGEMVESGTHEELLALNGVYSRLCALQLNEAQ
ncbi:MAG TPA: ABC transporter ATP-binding protein [Candidatus Acidoferrales bacterium]|nr:ABC transporter ATP-binding protein [Candidatus Acidoferrales bacterium]